jgi:hypothetical protein
LLDILEELIEAGGKASHHGDDNAAWSLDEISKLRGRLYGIVNLFAFPNNE